MTMISTTRFVAAALVAVGLAWTQQPPPAPPPGTGPPGGGTWAATHTLRVGVALGLSMEQRTEVQTILDNEASQLLPLVVQLRQNHRAIEALTDGGGTSATFDRQLQTLADTHGSLVSRITVIRGKASSQIWALLTPEQRERASQMPGLLHPEGMDGMGMESGLAGSSTRNRMMRPGQPMQ